MFFLGRTFLKGTYCGDHTPTYIENINLISFYNAIFNETFISLNPEQDINDLSWDFNTVFHAKFLGNLLAGNLDFSISSVTSVIIKRRIKGTIDDWLPIFKIQIDGDEKKLKFERYDKYVANHENYEYAIVFLFNNVEGNYNINDIIVDFCGMYIMEKEKVYRSVLENEIQVRREHPSSIIQTIDSKYPFVINSSKNDYYSGNVSAMFVEQDVDTYELKLQEGYKYRKGVLDFLNNGNPKILKNEEGEIWIIITQNPTENRIVNTDKVITEFLFTEIGDANNAWDLYDNGLLDDNIDIYNIMKR